MIENDTQYKVTGWQLEKFKESLTNAKSNPLLSDIARRAYIDSAQSMIEELENQLREYELLQADVVKEYSKAHPAGSMNMIGNQHYPDGNVPYAQPQEATEIDPKPRPRMCEYCGSMHPSDVAGAINNGAWLELANMKYGYPHKIYLHNVPVYDWGKIYTNHLRDATPEEKAIIEQSIGIEFTFDEKGMGWRSLGRNK